MLADCIRLAQTNNEALEALLQKFAPLIKKCGRQLHIEDGNEEMILAFIELVITLMFENSLTAAEIARRWGCSRQSVNQGKIVALKKLRKTFSTPISTKTLHNIERAKR